MYDKIFPRHLTMRRRLVIHAAMFAIAVGALWFGQWMVTPS